MTVRELLDVLAVPLEIFIKPAGRRAYFDGTTEEVPEGLLDAVVQEVAPRVAHDEDPFATKRYYGFLGIWVEPIAEWDERADQEQAAAKLKKIAERVKERTPIRDELLEIDEDEERVR